jgi:hypothetical protein
MSNNEPDYKDNLYFERKEMLEPYNYNDEPSGRTDTLIQALDKLEKMKQALELAKGFYRYCMDNCYPVAMSNDFQDDYKKICEALEND